jgi:tetratricopeptide (TPR) repeat protein
MRSPLGDAIGRDQAKFVEDTLKQFQDGNLDEALKRAIPLGSMKEALDDIDHPFTGRFMPRSELSISLQKSKGSQSVSLDEQVLEMLKHTYQKAFEKLDSEGRIEEAAFVLVDLLQDVDQAISYLEKHKKYLMAAQIAEGHQVNPARIIRQWILADDWERAIQIARISNRYEEAITLLSDLHKEAADQLRWTLAEMHYTSGNLETAVEIGWPIIEKRSIVVPWLKECIALGGVLTIRYKFKLALYDQDGEDEFIPEFENLLQDDTSSCALQRLQLIDELNQYYPTNSLTQSLASMAVRPYLRDVAKGWIHHDNSRWNRLITLSNDQVLRSDVSRITINKSNSKQLLRSQKQPIQYELSNCFGRQVLDCQRLADGSLLLAFGEAGLEHRSPQGELLASYPDICHQIVISDQGYQALLIAAHEGFQVINIFDLMTRSTSYWQQTKLDAWADSYDGLSWIVAKADRLWVLDLKQDSIVSLWSVGDLKGNVSIIRRDPYCFSFLVQGETSNELWKYQLPDLFLKERTPWGHKTLTAIPADISSSGKLLLVSTDLASFAFYSTGEEEFHPMNEGNCQQLWAFSDWLVISSKSETSNHLSVYAHTESDGPSLLLDIPYPQDEQLACHCDGDFLLLYSNAGRILVIELEYGGVVVELTV